MDTGGWDSDRALAKDSLLGKVREVTDPVLLGVHPARPRIPRAPRPGPRMLPAAVTAFRPMCRGTSTTGWSNCWPLAVSSRWSASRRPGSPEPRMRRCGLRSPITAS